MDFVKKKNDFLDMGQKVHPLGLRIGITQQHRSKWFANPKNYAENLLEDTFLRKTLQKDYPEARIIDIHIERKLDQIHVSVRSVNPGVFLNKKGEPLEKLRYRLEQKLESFRLSSWKRSSYPNIQRKPIKSTEPQIALHIKELTNLNDEAGYLAQFIVEQLEKRAPFRRAMRQGIQRIQRAKIPGVKIEISGRLNGAEIARTEWIREGRVPLQTLRANIDYSYQTAQTIYGILGVKVWLFRGEKV
uniref:Small ribosomal subunit protein uS3c n=1 Tax=Marsupiomonas sp. NIES 1824 TaxID=1562198 RepID=A0A097KLX1_9CHLO|nr:ribosomal protein S3 [Marsupiomonas sp. NIES 1824]